MKSLTFLIFISLLVSCGDNRNNNFENQNQQIDTMSNYHGVQFEYNPDGTRKSQVLIQQGDTVHTVLYENDKIISSEGQFVTTLTTLKNGRKVDFEFFMIKIDTLRTVVVLDHYNDSTGRYEVDFSYGALDSTYFKYTHEFKKDTAHVLCRVLYGNDSVVFSKHSGFHTIIFGTPSKIIATPEGSKQMKPKY